MAEDRDAETLREGKSPKAKPSAPLDHERYRPIREIARGGMGRVIEAFDTQLGRTVALKEILDEHHDARARFDREVEITARLEHPSIVPLYDAGRTATGMPFYVMRKVAGDPLDVLIRNARNLDQRLRLLPHVLALADAVAHAHARGVIHRDLKPTNVLVGELGETVVIDWGLAKLIGETDHPMPELVAGDSLHTRAGTVFGTPGFMPPEQLRGELVDERADVYALGACLFHVLAGERPDETPVFDLAGAPTELITIVKKAMAPERERRYLDAGGFSEDLRRFLGGQLVAAHHYPLHARIARGLRRHRALVAVIALALVLAIAGGVWSLQRIFAEQARAEEALVREQLRSDDLLVFKASSYLQRDPTLAAATLQQLRPDSPRWAALGTMLSGVRARGVAFGYPGVGTTNRFVETSPAPGDERILVWAKTQVRLIDPVARTSRVLADGPGLRAYWWRDRIVIGRGDQPDRVIDPVTGKTSPVPWPDDASLLARAETGAVFFSRKAGGTFAIDPTGRQIEISLPTPPTSLATDPSGRWLAATNNQHQYLLKAVDGRYEQVLALDGADPVIAFDGDRRLTIGTRAHTTEYDLAVTPPAVLRRWNERLLGLPRYIRGDLHWWSWQEVQWLHDDNQRVLFSRSHGLSPEAELPGRRSAVLVDPRQIDLSGSMRLTLYPPEPVNVLGGRADKRFLVAAGAARVFVWNLDDLAMRTTKIPVVDSIAFDRPDQLHGQRMFPEQVLRRFRLTPELELVEEASRPFPFHWELSVYPSGEVFLVDPKAGKGILLAPDRQPIDDIPDLEVMSTLDATSLVAGTRTGGVYRIDRATKVTTKVAELGFPIAGLAGRNGWIIAAAADGRLWRRDPQGRVTTARLARWRTPSLADDGTLFVGREHELVEWAVDGDPVVVSSFVQRLALPAILKVTPGHVIAATEDGTVYRFDRRWRFAAPLHTNVRTSAISDAERMVVIANDALLVNELATGESYQLAEIGAAGPSKGLAISADGTVVVSLAIAGERHVVASTWRLSPTSRDWLMQATNAIVPERVGDPITWR